MKQSLAQVPLMESGQGGGCRLAQPVPKAFDAHLVPYEGQNTEASKQRWEPAMLFSVCWPLREVTIQVLGQVMLGFQDAEASS